jgi:hypothetical protein
MLRAMTTGCTDPRLLRRKVASLVPARYPISTSSVAVICWRPSCGGRTSTAPPVRAIEEVARIVVQIRRRWPKTRVLLRGDSGFAREALMAWCEANRVDFLFGLARNERLEQAISTELMMAKFDSLRTGGSARRFKGFTWLTLDSWSRNRRVVGLPPSIIFHS